MRLLAEIWESWIARASTPSSPDARLASTHHRAASRRSRPARLPRDPQPSRCRTADPPRRRRRAHPAHLRRHRRQPHRRRRPHCRRAGRPGQQRRAAGRALYEEAFAKMLSVMQRREANGSPPDVAAATITRALTAVRPRSVHLTGKTPGGWPSSASCPHPSLAQRSVASSGCLPPVPWPPTRGHRPKA